MKKAFLLLVFPLLSVVAMAQSSFEGVITVFYTNDKNTTTICEVKAKGDDIYIKQLENGNSKYDRFVINLKTRELYTVSTHEKKVIIKYNIDSLVAYYDANKLKEDFVLNTGIDYKATDKTKKENGINMVKYTGESDLRKASLWLGETSAPVNTLIPFLRLLGNWNDADGNLKGQIIEAEVTNKVSKKDTKVIVNIKHEPVAKEMFILPKTYLQKDFSKLMAEMRTSPDLKMIIKTFAEF